MEERLTEKRHVVAPGETLAGIAQRYKVSQEQLRRHNNVQNPHLLSVGTELHIPLPVSARISPASSARTEARPETPASYEIQRGDSLSTIARKFKVSVSDLQAWNGIEDPAMIRAGQTLKVRAPAAAAPSQSSSGSAPKTYTIQSGDSLSTIARRFEVSVADLQRWNDIDDPSFIRRGQVLQLQGSAPKPSSSSEGSAASSSAQGTYTVASGDTLSSIASKHGVRSSDRRPGMASRIPASCRSGRCSPEQKSGQKKKAGSAGAKKSKIRSSVGGLWVRSPKYGVSVETCRTEPAPG